MRDNDTEQQADNEQTNGDLIDRQQSVQTTTRAALGDDAPENASPQHSTPIFHRRLVIGLVQGFLLYLLLQPDRPHVWPWTAPIPFAIAVTLMVMLPLLLIVGSGHISLVKMLRWMLPIGVCISVAAGYAEWRREGIAPLGYQWFGHHDFHETLFYLTPLVFIAWTLIQAGECNGRWRAAYRTYFDTSWKLAVQLKFAAAFVTAFWLVLWLGAGLFLLLKINFLARFIAHTWFWMPVTTLMIACGLHLTDVRPGIVNGIRNLLLSMLSWLLPLLAVLVAAFLVTVPFAGFDLLWKTRFAASLLLGTCAVLVILINTTWQAGDRFSATHNMLRYALVLACMLLLPLAAIAAYALSLRVTQYGWTPDRVLATFCVSVALFYAYGYFWAVFDRKGRASGHWLAPIATTNIYASWLIIVLGLSVLTPLADPARLSVNSQVGRLLAGETAADKFDYKFLRFDGVRYGKAALDDLARSDNSVIRNNAVAAIAAKSRWEAGPVAPLSIRNQLTLKTVGQTWPAGFLDMDWSKQQPNNWNVPNCLKQAGAQCDAFVGDFSGHGRMDVLLVPEKFGNAALATNESEGWRIVATYEAQGRCPSMLNALAQGNYRSVPPIVPDIEAGDRRLRAVPVQNKAATAKCD
jgi:hypothetical protein